MPATRTPLLAANRIPALEGEFAYAGGAATSGSVGGGRWSAALMADSGTEDYIRAGFQIPDGWSSVDVKMIYTTAVTGTGGTDTRWWTYVSVAELGETLAANRTQSFQTYTADTTVNLPVEVDVFTGVAVAPRELVSVTVGRNSNRAEDTFGGGSVGVLVLSIERVA